MIHTCRILDRAELPVAVAPVAVAPAALAPAGAAPAAAVAAVTSRQAAGTTASALTSRNQRNQRKRWKRLMLIYSLPTPGDTRRTCLTASCWCQAASAKFRAPEQPMATE